MSPSSPHLAEATRSSRRRSIIPHLQAVLMILLLPLLLILPACYAQRGSHGGGQTKVTTPRQINPADIILPPPGIASNLSLAISPSPPALPSMTKGVPM